MGAAASVDGNEGLLTREEATVAIQIAFERTDTQEGRNHHHHHRLKISDIIKKADPVTNYVAWKDAYAKSFVPAKEPVGDKEWTGTLIDTFSPDFFDPKRKPWDPERKGRRFIDIGENGDICISGSDGDGSQWGRRFDKTTSVNPTISKGTSSDRKCSFLSKAPEDTDAKAGALNFIVELGTVLDGSIKCIRWTTLYEGKGGTFKGVVHPPSQAENFWCYVSDAKKEVKEEKVDV